MSITGYFFLITVGILMLLPFVLMFVKADYHLEYLKLIYPEKFGKYLNFFDATRNIFYHQNFSLLLASFNRLNKLETTDKLKKLGDKIVICCNLIYISVIALVFYIVAWIVLSRIISL